MSASDPTPRGPLVEGPRDPEHDPAAALRLEPEYVSTLTGRIVATSGESKQTHSPLDGAPLASIPQSTEADVDEAFARARRAQLAWARTSFADRRRVLMRLHDLMMERQQEIVDLIVLESGKARKDAYLEPMHCALTARHYARMLETYLSTRRVPGVMPLLTRVEVNRVPKGVVGIISPWNYPVAMALVDGIAALAAGNAVVAKPDAQTMLSALLGAQLIEEAGFPKGLWQVVAGPGSRVGTNIVERADYICFTGSTATGKIIAKGCADRLIGCSLELGGKNPMLVLADADVERAAEAAVRVAFSNSGQMCVSAERFIVADAVYERFVDRFVARTQAMTLGATLEWDNDMGPLISADQLETVTRHVDDAVAKGATVLTGGQHRPDLGPYFFEPTILEGVTPEMELYAGETFGPVVSVYRVGDEAEAVERANEGVYGLNAAIFSRDRERARMVASRIKAGSVNVNEGYLATFASMAAPMGGMRESGMGRRQGAEGILRFTEGQSVATQHLVRFGPMFGMSHESYSKLLTLSLKALDKLGRA